MTAQQSNLLSYLGWRETNFTPASKRPPLTVGETYITHNGKEVMCAQSEYDDNGNEPTILISCDSGWVFIAYGAQVMGDGVRIKWNSANGGHKYGEMPFDHYFADLFVDGLPWVHEDSDEEEYF